MNEWFIGLGHYPRVFLVDEGGGGGGGMKFVLQAYKLYISIHVHAVNHPAQTLSRPFLFSCMDFRLSLLFLISVSKKKRNYFNKLGVSRQKSN